MLWEPRALEIWETFVKNEAFELVGSVRILIGTYGANEHFRQEENTQKQKYNVHAGEYGYLTWAEARGKWIPKSKTVVKWPVEELNSRVECGLYPIFTDSKYL